jgi:arginine N-succinyltransferase
LYVLKAALNMVAFEIRGAHPSDEDQLLAVAHFLDTVNLPEDRESIRSILDQAQKSFTGAIKDPRRCEYVFVLVDNAQDKIIGTSMIIGQLGRKEAPYIYVDVIDEERYSATIDRHFKHTTLNIGYSFNGPTEIGGLILMPEYRRVPERLGQFISYVRFLFIKMHRERFRDEVLAELLPPLEPDGTSHLWDALGKKFTGLTYAEADLLSKKNKEFIKSLWPEHAIYATLLPEKAQEVIGKVGAQTRGVEKMLRRIGFRYAERVDPFDGGPHFTAPTDEITLVARSRKAKIVSLIGEGETPEERAVLGIDLADSPHFRAVLAPWKDPSERRRESNKSVHEHDEPKCAIGQEAAEHLGLKVGDSVWVLPLD